MVQRFNLGYHVSNCAPATQAMAGLEAAWETAAAHQYTLLGTLHRPSRMSSYRRCPCLGMGLGGSTSFLPVLL